MRKSATFIPLLRLISVIVLLASEPGHSQEKNQTPADPPKAKGKHPAFAEVEDVPGLPRVLLIGDSISMGYTLRVRRALEGKANVHRAKANCGPTDTALKHIDTWTAGGPWDLIHFNWGLHDVIHVVDKRKRVPHTTPGAAPRIPPEAYEKNLRSLVASLKKTGATLVWCATTPIPESSAGIWKQGDARRYNEIAARVMGENHIAINDLWTFANPELSEIQRPADVHFTDKGYGRLGAEVARVVVHHLKDRKQSADESGTPAFTREDAAAFLAAMADDVERWHVKSDPESPQRGTINEFVIRTRLKGDQLPETDQGRWGQWIQASLGDTYHSGAYYTAAMIQAWRATGDERYRTAAKTRQLPLIVRMARESDTLFPEQIPTVRAGVELKIEKPMKGYIPFWWDDGSSISLAKNGEKINEKQPVVGGLEPNPENRRQGYPRRISQHLAQSLGVMFLEAWWMEPDDAELVEAIRLHQEFYERASPWGNMWTVAGVAGYVCGNEKWLRFADVLGTPYEAARNCRTYVNALRDRRWQAPSFADGTHYRYYGNLCRHGGRLSDANALFLINNGLNHSLMTEAWSDEPAFEPGMERYDRGSGAWFIVNGKPVKYRSEKDVPLGSRVGPQHLSLTALALQALREKGEIWDELPGETFPDDLVVPIRQSAESAAWSEPWKAGEGGTEFTLAARRHGLMIRGKTGAKTVDFRIRLRPEGKNDQRHPEGRFTISADGKISARNDAGESLTVSAKRVEPTEDGSGFTFELDLPYTRVKGQNEWINGADHFRYEISADGQTGVFYLLTPSREITPWMERHLVRGLTNWKRIFAEKGYIPGALNRPVNWGPADKRDISHLYGYAFLASTCAQYIIYQDGKNYWNLLTETR